MDTTQPVNSMTRNTQLRRRALQASLGELPRLRATARHRPGARAENLAASDPSSDSSLHPDAVRPSPLLRLVAVQREGAGGRAGAPAGTASAALAGIGAASLVSRLAPGSQAITGTTSTAATAGTSFATTTTTTTTTTTATTTTIATTTTTNTSAAATASAKPGNPGGGSELAFRLFGATRMARAPAYAPVSLHDAVLTGDWNSAARLAADGGSIFAPMTYGEPGSPAAHIRRQPSISILEFALDHSQKECALGMALHCQTRRQERDARLLDMLRLAVRKGRWERVAGLLFVIQHVQLRLRSRSFDELVCYLLRSDEMHLACLTLRIGPARALTCEQSNKLVEATLKWGSHAVMKHLLVLDPELIRTRACSVQRVLECASPEVLVALLEAGYQPQAISARQLEPLLVTLLQCAQQQHACALLQRYPEFQLPADELEALVKQCTTAELPRRYRAALRLDVGQLLQTAIDVQANHFLELLLARLPVHDPALQDSLYAAQKSAIWQGYGKGVQMLSGCGVDLYQNPPEGRALLRQLIEKGRKHSLAALVRTGILTLRSVFLRLILRGQLSVLCELQRILKMSFCVDVSDLLQRPRADACTQTLRQLLTGMRLAGQGRQGRAERMLCVGLEAGLDPVSARNFAQLRDRLLQAGVTLQASLEQQHLLLMAACLEKLRPPARIAWPAPLDGSQSARVDDEMESLSRLGQGVIADAGERLHAECLLELKGGDGPPASRLSRRLQADIGLPADLADLLERSLQALHQGQATQQGARSDQAAARLAQEILRGLQGQVKPSFDSDHPLTAWQCAGWQMVATLARRLTIDSSAQ
jgi:hypothetical protein